MGWLIVGLFGLVLLGVLVVVARGLGGYRRPADDTLITELLGPPMVPAVPAPLAGEEAEPSPVRQAREEAKFSHAPRAREEGEPSPSPSVLPDGEDDWLETQLAWITAWSQRMHQQIESAGRPEPDRKQ